MKKDINFLECKANEEEKGNSSLMTIVAITGVFLILCLMGFMFFTTKLECKKNDLLIKDLNQQKISIDRSIKRNSKEYKETRQRLTEILSQTYATTNTDKIINNADHFSKVIIDTIFNETVNKKENYNEGESPFKIEDMNTEKALIYITEITINEGKIIVKANTDKGEFYPGEYVERLRTYENLFSGIKYDGFNLKEEIIKGNANPDDPNDKVEDTINSSWTFELVISINNSWEEI